MLGLVQKLLQNNAKVGSSTWENICRRESVRAPPVVDLSSNHHPYICLIFDRIGVLSALVGPMFSPGMPP